MQWIKCFEERIEKFETLMDEKKTTEQTAYGRLEPEVSRS